MKKILLPVALLLVMFCLNAQAKSKPLSPEKLLNYQPIPVQDGMVLSVAVQDDATFRIPLEENPTTGYQWDVKCEGNAECLKVVGASFYPPQAQLPPPEKKSKHHHDKDDSPRLAGAPGLKLFTLKAEHSGTAILRFRHARNWEHGAEKEFTVIVFITED